MGKIILRILPRKSGGRVSVHDRRATKEKGKRRLYEEEDGGSKEGGHLHAQLKKEIDWKRGKNSQHLFGARGSREKEGQR